MNKFLEYISPITQYLTIERVIIGLALFLYYIKKRFGTDIEKRVKATPTILDDIVWDGVCASEYFLNGKGGLLKFGGAKAMILKEIVDKGIEIPTDKVINDLIEKNHTKLETKLNEIKGVEENVEKVKNDYDTVEKQYNKPNKKTVQLHKEPIQQNNETRLEEIKANERIAINKADNDLLADILKINENVNKTSMWANVAFKNKGFNIKDTEIAGTIGAKWVLDK